MYAGLNHPDRFGAVVCQLVHSGLGSNVKLSVFMEVGLGEDIMVDLSQDLYQQLKQQNHRLSFRTFDGGSELA